MNSDKERIKELEHHLRYILDGLSPTISGFCESDSVTNRAYTKAKEVAGDWESIENA